MKTQRGTKYFLLFAEVLSRLQPGPGMARAADKLILPSAIALRTILALSVLCALGGCSRQAPPPRDVVRPVKTMVVAAGGEQQNRTFSGRAQAAQEAELASQVSGLLVSLPIREGQRVAKGDVIAQLRQEEFEARVKDLEAQLEQGRVALRTLQAGARPEERAKLEANLRAAQAKLATATAEHERYTRLKSTKVISKAEFDTAERTLRVAQEEAEAAQQRLKISATGRPEDIEAQEAGNRGLEEQVRKARIQLEDSTLHAPFDGVIAQRFVEQNQNVNALQPIARLQHAGEMDIAVDVPEAVMGGVTADRIVNITAEFTAAPGVQFPVTITEVAQVADPVTQTFRVRGSMKSQPGAAVLPGMTATVTLTYRHGAEGDKRLLVPVTAVKKEASSGEQIVWLIGNDHVVKRRPVKIGQAGDGQLEIVDGLQAGERIAVAGVSFLREGMPVRDLGTALGD
jgi:RND family efflux transporter MFP subunit